MNIWMKTLFTIVVIGIIASMFVQLNNIDGTYINFSYIIQVVQNTPNITTSLVLPDISIGSDWGFLNFLRDIINNITGLVSFVAWIVVNLIQLAIYLIYFVKSIFVGL